jgi:hypothetical protein
MKWKGSPIKMEMRREVEGGYNFLISRASQFPQFQDIFRKAPQLCKDVPYYFETCTAKIPPKKSRGGDLQMGLLP